MTEYKTLMSSLFAIALVFGTVACADVEPDTTEDIDTVEEALRAAERGDARVEWRTDERPDADARRDGAHEFRGCVTLRRVGIRRVLHWIRANDISPERCFDSVGEREPHRERDAQRPDAERPDAERPDAEQPDAERPDAERPDAERPTQSGPTQSGPSAKASGSAPIATPSAM